MLERSAKTPAALHAATMTPGIHDRIQGRARGRLGRRSWPSGSIALMTAKALYQVSMIITHLTGVSCPLARSGWRRGVGHHKAPATRRAG